MIIINKFWLERQLQKLKNHRINTSGYNTKIPNNSEGQIGVYIEKHLNIYKVFKNKKICTSFWYQKRQKLSTFLKFTVESRKRNDAQNKYIFS